MTSLYLNNPIKSWNYTHYSLRYGLLGLLMVNLAFFISNEMMIRTADAIAWLMILVFLEWPRGKFIGTTMTFWYSIIQITALGMISVSCESSFIQEDWVSLANELTWLCVLLFPTYTYKKYTFLKPVLYVSLAGYASYWGINQAWLECYDAALWITAFLQLENEKYNSCCSLDYNSLYNGKIIRM